MSNTATTAALKCFRTVADIVELDHERGLGAYFRALSSMNLEWRLRGGDLESREATYEHIADTMMIVELRAL